MRITIIAVGKIREKWISEGVAEYSKRLKRFCRLEIVELNDEKVPTNYSAREIDGAIEREGRRMLDKWPQNSWTVAMEPRGKAVGSEALAKLIDRKALGGQSHFVFIIGGSNGLSREVLEKCDQSLSFGPNTFPHQLFRVMLLEQIYRAQKIRAGETYHK